MSHRSLSRATSCADVPALRANCAPLPGLSSMQCMTLPNGKLRRGIALPTLIGADDPERTVAPAFRPSGAMMYPPLPVLILDEGDVRRAIRVVLQSLNRCRYVVFRSFEVYFPVVLLMSTTSVSGSNPTSIIPNRPDRADSPKVVCRENPL